MSADVPVVVQRAFADVLDALDRHGVGVDPRLRLVPSDLPNPYYDRVDRTIAAGMPAMEGGGRLQWLVLARMLGVATVDEARAAVELQMPFVMAHEVAHHLRDHHGTESGSEFIEETVANRIGLAFVFWHPDHRERIGELRASLARAGVALRRLASGASEFATGFRADLGDTLVAEGMLTRDRLESLRRLGPLEDVLDPAALARAREVQRRSARRLNQQYTSDLSEYALFHQEWLLAAMEHGTPMVLADELAAHVLPGDVGAARRAETADMLVALLDHRESRLAMAAAVALADVDAARLQTHLVAMSRSADPVLRTTAAALAGDHAALAADLDGPDRGAALEAIAVCGDARAAGLATSHLAAREDEHRVAAARALARHPRPDARLVSALDDPVAAVRGYAADALRALGPAAEELFPGEAGTTAAAVEAAAILGTTPAIDAATDRIRATIAAIDAADLTEPRAAALLVAERSRLARLALRAAGRPKAIDAAVAALASDDPVLQQAGRELAADAVPELWRDDLLALLDGAPAGVAPVAPEGPLGALLAHDPAEADDMHTTVEKLLFLREVPMFARAGVDDLYDLAGEARFRRHPAGEMVFRAGGASDEMLVVVSGRLEVLLGERTLMDLGRGHSVGEMGVLTNEVRAVDVRAAEDSAVLAISATTLRRAGTRQPELLLGVIRWLGDRLRDANRERAIGQDPPAAAHVR